MLTICPTPIGNLDDVTERQKTALADADVVACEDTRRTGKLLEHLGIERDGGRPRLVAHHEHNETESTRKLLRALEAGREVVVVSDAGTPLISDPGFELVRAALEADFEVRALPGPSAALVALSASGLPAHAFQFRGFPPQSREARRKFLREIDSEDLTTVLYESPKRVEGLVADVVSVCGGERRICAARELTKLHEEYLRGTASAVLAELEEREEIRGEFTLVVGPRPEGEGRDEEEVERKIRELLDRGLSPRSIKELVAELYGVPRSELYDRIEEVTEEGP